MKKHALLTIGRVIRHASAGKWRFYTGVVFRILERCIAILPLLLSFYWLQQQFEMSEQYWLWLATPVDYLLTLAGRFLAQLICAYIGQYQSFVGSYRIVHAYRIKLINHVRQLPLGHLQRAVAAIFRNAH